MRLMRACILHHPAPVESNPLEYTDVPKPAPSGTEVLVRVNACGICRTDLHVIEGELPVRKSPITPGHQVVGVVEATGDRATEHAIGTRVGIAWLHSTDGTCEYCRANKENLCNNPTFTGWTVDGGYAEYALAEESFVYPIPEGFDDLKAAPLLCAGIIGFRSLRLSGIGRGGRLGLYGFGAAASVAIQVARHWGAEVYACTRDERHQKLALELGAVWAGGTVAEPPQKLDSAIVFAPAGEIVPAAFKALRKGGTLALGGIHMSEIPSFSYDLLWGERSISSVANLTRKDAAEFMSIAPKVPVRTVTESFRLEDANEALNWLRSGKVQGAAVLNFT